MWTELKIGWIVNLWSYSKRTGLGGSRVRSHLWKGGLVAFEDHRNSWSCVVRDWAIAFLLTAGQRRPLYFSLLLLEKMGGILIFKEDLVFQYKGESLAAIFCENNLLDILWGQEALKDETGSLWYVWSPFEDFMMNLVRTCHVWQRLFLLRRGMAVLGCGFWVSVKPFLLVSLGSHHKDFPPEV